MHSLSRIRALPQLSVWIRCQVAALPPGCFALVMATGIISNALSFEGYRGWANGLFAINLIAYPCLIVLTGTRFALFARALWADLINPRVIFSFFTIVAGTDVLGVGIKLHGYATAALFMWLFALVIWFALIYFSFAVLIFLNTARAADILDGGWLIAIVGTHSLVILGTIIAPATGAFSATVFVLIYMLWGIGLALYGIFIAQFSYRIFFLDVEPDDITPFLWVVMGAAAIATNAGSTLILADSGMPFLQSMRPFIDGVTLVMWAWATWWIPLLLLFGVWKHGVRGVPLRYTPMFWSLVFPLGMYALASLRLSLATDFSPLRTISQAMVWVAFAAWATTGFAFVLASFRSFRDFVRSAR